MDISEKRREAFKLGQIFIETEPRTFKAGDKVKAVIHMHIKSPYPTTALNLLITGIEKTRWAHEAKYES